MAMTTSVGTLAKLSLVFAAVDYIKKKSKNILRKMCCQLGFMDPLLWIALIVRCGRVTTPCGRMRFTLPQHLVAHTPPPRPLRRCCCLAYLNMLTKWCLIFHTFTGEAFWESAKVRRVAGPASAALSGLTTHSPPSARWT